MKKVLAIILAVMMVLSLACCGSKTEVAVEPVTKEVVATENTIAIEPDPILETETDVAIENQKEIGIVDTNKYTKYSSLYHKVNDSYLERHNYSKDWICVNCGHKEIKSMINFTNADAGLNGISLTEEELIELKNAEPLIVKEKIKTVAEALEYIRISKLKCPEAHSLHAADWVYGTPGYEVIKTKAYSDCTAMSNLVAYLLNGDYEEIGTIRWVGYFNHVMNYVKYNGKYYSFNMGTGKVITNFYEMDDLGEFAEKLDEENISTYNTKNFTKIIAYKIDNENMINYPSAWISNTKLSFLTQPKFVFPKEAEGKINVLWDRFGDEITYKEVKENIRGWNAPVV